MLQICECGETMVFSSKYHEVVFGNNDHGRLAARRVYRCPVCERERTTDGRGKNVGIKGRMA